MRNYRTIVCFLRDSGRCKYAPSKPFDSTCFCEQIDECARKENELLDKIVDEVRKIKRDPRSPWPYPFEDRSRLGWRDGVPNDDVRRERHTNSASSSETM